MYRNDTLNNSHAVQRCYFLSFDTTKIDQLKNVYIATATVDAILIIPTIVLNIILIISLRKSSEMRKPSTKLILSLAMSDVLVGLTIEPAFLAKKIGEFNHDFSLYCKNGLMTYVAGTSLSAVSFFNLTAIAIDRYLVVHRGNHYRHTVTNFRVTIAVAIIWFSGIFIPSGQLYAHAYSFTRPIYFKAIAGIMIACVFITYICYIRCFITLKKHQRVSGKLFESTQKVPATCSYNKSIYTMFYVFVAFGLCYLPFTCTSVTAGIVGESAAIWGAESLSAVAMYVNSLVNPLLLLWRMRKVRAAIVRTVSKQRNNNLILQNIRQT